MANWHSTSAALALGTCALACAGQPEIELPRTHVVAEGLAHVNQMSLDGRRLVVSDRQDISEIDLDTLHWSRLVAHVDPERILAADGRIYYRARDRVDSTRMHLDELDPETSTTTRLLTQIEQPTRFHEIVQLVDARAGELFVVATNTEAQRLELLALRATPSGVEQRTVLPLEYGQRWAVMQGRWIYNPTRAGDVVLRYDLESGEQRTFAASSPIIDMAAAEDFLIVRTWDESAGRWDLLRLENGDWSYLVQGGMPEEFPSGIRILDCGVVGVTTAGLDFYPWQGAPSRPFEAKLWRGASAADGVHAFVSDGSFVYRVRVCDE